LAKREPYYRSAAILFSRFGKGGLEVFFDKNLLFDGKSLWEKKDPVKEKNRSKGREIREASGEKGTMPVGTL